jgi:hypothetical protein
MVASKPLHRANAVIISSRKPLSRVGNLQPSATELKKLGIRVRDFAFEKTLPPVQTLHFHRQILPAVARPVIARQKTEEDLHCMFFTFSKGCFSLIQQLAQLQLNHNALPNASDARNN